MATAPVRTKEKITTSGTSDLAHVVRVLGPETMEFGGNQITSYQDAENHLREAYFKEGWELFSTEVISIDQGRQMGGLRFNPITMLYVLIKRA